MRPLRWLAWLLAAVLLLPPGWRSAPPAGPGWWAATVKVGADSPRCRADAAG
jgi:hypothetical protein